jgi:hypothetical protein
MNPKQMTSVLTGTNAKVLTPQVSLAESSRIGSNMQEAVGHWHSNTEIASR